MWRACMAWTGPIRNALHSSETCGLDWAESPREGGGGLQHVHTVCRNRHVPRRQEEREKRGGGEVDRRLAGFRDRWRTKYGERPDGCFTEAKGHKRDGGSCMNKPVAVKEKEGVTYGRGGVGGGGRAG